MDWVTASVAIAAALGVGAREGVTYFKKAPEVGESINKIVDTLAHFTELLKGVTSEEVTYSISAIKEMAEIINREDPENPGQKLVWSHPAMRRAIQSMREAIQQLASNIDTQTRILKQIVDVVKVMESEIREIKYESRNRST